MWDERVGLATRRGLLLVSVLSLPLLAAAWLWGDAAVARHGADLTRSFAELPRPAQLTLRYALVLFYLGYLGLFIVGVRRRLFELVEMAGVYFVSQLLISAALVHLLKIGFGRPRPYMGDVAWQPGADTAAFHSFPSGHSADVAVGLAVLLCRQAPTWLRVAAALVFAVTVAGRVLEHQHYPTDIVVGAFLGFAGVIGVAAISARLLWRHPPGAPPEQGPKTAPHTDQ